MFGFVEMILFVIILTIGFVYAWKKGALEWHSIR
jgi:NADH-quinone oxidoreductase subunit A